MRFIKITLLVIGISGSLFLITSLIVLSNGMSELTETHRSMEEFFEWQDEEAVLTGNEKRFHDSLTKCGFYVEMHRPYVDRLEYYENFDYRIVIEPSELYSDPKNHQLLNPLSEQLASQLINILPDSVLFKIDNLKLEYRLKNEKTANWNSQLGEFILEITKTKKEIDSILGAQVIEKNGVFLREPFAR